MTRGLVGSALVGQLQLGTGNDGAASPEFTISPTSGHTTGVVNITATFSGGATSSASNTFSVASGPASGISNYVKTGSTTATFDLTTTAVSSTPVVIAESQTGTTQNFSNAAVVPGAPTSVVGTAGDGEVSVAFTAPADDGGATITSYTATSSPGGLTASGGSSPLVVTGLTNFVAYTFTVTATNTAGTGPASSPSSAVTPEGEISTVTIQQVAPFLSTDTLTAPGYQVYTGLGVAIGSLVTTGIASFSSEPNGRLGAIEVTLDGVGSFTGYALWETGEAVNVYAPLELFVPPNEDDGLGTRDICKVVVFPYGTAMTSPGFQLYQNVAGTMTAVGSRVTAGVTAIPSLSLGRSALVSCPLAADGSFYGAIVWDNGAGVYAPPDQVAIPPLIIPEGGASVGFPSSSRLGGVLQS